MSRNLSEKQKKCIEEAKKKSKSSKNKDKKLEEDHSLKKDSADQAWECVKKKCDESYAKGEPLEIQEIFMVMNWTNIMDGHQLKKKLNEYMLKREKSYFIKE